MNYNQLAAQTINLKIFESLILSEAFPLLVIMIEIQVFP